MNCWQRLDTVLKTKYWRNRLTVKHSVDRNTCLIERRLNRCIHATLLIKNRFHHVFILFHLWTTLFVNYLPTLTRTFPHGWSYKEEMKLLITQLSVKMEQIKPVCDHLIDEDVRAATSGYWAAHHTGCSKAAGRFSWVFVLLSVHNHYFIGLCVYYRRILSCPDG